METVLSFEQQRRWMQQRRQAALAEQKTLEMRALTETEARTDSEMLLGGTRFREYASVDRDADGHELSGLVEQQRLFQRARELSTHAA